MPIRPQVRLRVIKTDGLAIRPTEEKIVTAETWNRAAPPGFQGLRTDIPVTVYYRHLPHWRQDGATYFVTFRLADSLLPTGTT